MRLRSAGRAASRPGAIGRAQALWWHQLLVIPRSSKSPKSSKLQLETARSPLCQIENIPVLPAKELHSLKSNISEKGPFSALSFQQLHNHPDVLIELIQLTHFKIAPFCNNVACLRLFLFFSFCSFFTFLLEEVAQTFQNPLNN